MTRRHSPRYLPRFLPLVRAMPGRIANRAHRVESVLRTCQLVLIIWCAVLGAQWTAKGVVWAATALVALLH